MYQTQPQNYGYQQQVNRPIYQTNPMPYQGIKGRPVSSIEEARACMIDFDGSVFYFPDIANKRIYTKQINMDGTAMLNVYELKQLPLIDPTTVQSNFVTREEFELAITQLRESLIAPQMPAAVKQNVEPAPAQKPIDTSVALNF